MNRNLPVIPVFFACDDNYAPLLGIAIESMLKNSSRDHFYRIHILTVGFNERNTKRLMALAGENSEILMENTENLLSGIAHRLALRDYYSLATYYRLFIAEMFPQYDKAFYFDSDMLFTGDISRLYATELGDNLVAAVREEVMEMEPVFGNYAERVVGVPVNDYFNAGMLLMNLKAFREQGIERKFIELIGKYTFRVTQDQDYLNYLCKGHTVIVDYTWNKTPTDAVAHCDGLPNIIHYKLLWRPWQTSDLLYEDVFWSYVEKSSFCDDLLAMRINFTELDRIALDGVYERLMKMAIDDTVKADKPYTVENLALTEEDDCLLAVAVKRK